SNSSLPDRNLASHKVPVASASFRANRIACRFSLVPQKTFHSLSSKRETRSAEKLSSGNGSPRAVERSAAGFCQTQSCSPATGDQFPWQNRETPRRFAMPPEKLHRPPRQDIRPPARRPDRNLRSRERLSGR